MTSSTTPSAANCDRSIPRASRAEIEQAISLLFQQGDVVEVRIPKTRAGVISGYFDSFPAMAAAIAEADARYRAGGVYYVLNRTDRALLGRAYNRLKEHAGYTTNDSNIRRRRWLPVDLDPVRPAGVSSSDDEHDAALAGGRTIGREMSSEGGEPILADSGNGAHLLYPLDL